ncbi:MAG: hypothetical protein RTU30_12980 [Candidatus Thorarchaeota archaeon]
MPMFLEPDVVEEQQEPNQIASLTPNSKRINVVFRVLQISDIRRVTAKFSGQYHQVADAIVADTSAKITLTLWNDDIDLFEAGQSYQLRNGFITIYDCSMRLSIGRSGKITKLDAGLIEIKEEVNMSLPFAWREPRRRKRGITGKTFSGKKGRESKGYCSWKSF